MPTSFCTNTACEISYADVYVHYVDDHFYMYYFFSSQTTIFRPFTKVFFLLKSEMVCQWVFTFNNQFLLPKHHI